MLRSLFTQKRIQTISILLLFALGAAIRLYDLGDPPMDFHPARQYHSALIARGLYSAWGSAYPVWQAEIHHAQAMGEARIEPPIFEYLTAATFTLAHSDALWIPRLYAILFWLAGGVPLYLLAQRWGGYGAALVALGVYLLLPYGVIASRSFQPDPIMVCCLLCALWALDRWEDRPTLRRAAAAGACMGAAILLKQVAVFMLLAALAGVLLARWSWRGVLNRRDTWLMAALAVLPALLYNLYGLFISRTLAGQYSQRFFPDLWLEPGFYIRWSSMIQQTAGLLLFLLSLLGLLLVGSRTRRGLVLGFLAGYLVYGFVFAHHISTHDYYQLPVLPLVALGSGLAANRLLDAVRQASGARFGLAAAALVLLAGAVLSLWEARASLKRENYRDQPAKLQQVVASMGGRDAALVGLTVDYGAALNYYTYNLPAYFWPQAYPVPLESMSPAAIADSLRERLAGKAFFIVTDFKALQAQPQLQAYLQENCPVFYQDTGIVVYDLRQEGEP